VSFRAILRVTLRLDPQSDGRLVEIEVLYCDQCNRWGRLGSVHICNETWSAHVTRLLDEIAGEET
jgi:hypothetical protein